jgi:cytochrome c oxidase subunit 3
MSITAIQEGKKNLSMSLVGMTILFAVVFLVNKYFEWSHKISLGIYPQSPDLVNKPPGEILYFGLYYVMTGLHALHVIIGMAILAVMMTYIKNGRINKHSFVRLEAGGLYWHLVDIIWIFLFPLFYLIQ